MWDCTFRYIGTSSTGRRFSAAILCLRARLSSILNRFENTNLTRHLQGHSLASLLANLQEIFSAQPPVYARPPTQPSDAPPRPPARPAPPVSSIPDQLPMYRPPPAGPPPLSVNTSPRPPNSAAGPPPVPPSPLRLHTRQDSLPGQATVTGSPLQAYAAPGQLIPDPRNPPPVTGPPLARRPHEMYRPQITSPANGYSPDAYRPVGQQQAPRSPHATPQPRSAPKPPIRDLFDVDDEGLAPITPQSQSPAPFAEGVAPPSRPLPPTTLHLHSLLSAQLAARLPLLLSHLTSQTTQLESVRADLESGEPAIRDEMARLEAVRGVCEGVVAKVGEVVKNGEKRCEELEQRGEVSVDEVVCSISIVHNQYVMRGAVGLHTNRAWKAHRSRGGRQCHRGHYIPPCARPRRGADRSRSVLKGESASLRAAHR